MSASHSSSASLPPLAANQAAIMIALQADMNGKVDPDWVSARYPYLRAVVIEGAEAIEHHGWKWWKKQDTDLAQLQMELIDIWHFMLSELLLRHGADQQATGTDLLQRLENADQQLTIDGKKVELASLDPLGALELLIACSALRRVEISLFALLMGHCGLDWDELFRQYVGKNVLNFFRQDNGYKEGHYQKLWNGKEDNEVLVTILDGTDPHADDFRDSVYRQLAAAYPS